MLASWFAQIDVPPLDQEAPGGLRSLLDATFVLIPVGLIVGVLGHLAGSRPVVAIGIALVMVGTALFVIAIGSYG